MEATEYKSDTIHLLLLGYIFDPCFPEKSNFDILRNTAEHFNSDLELFNYLNQLTGRFVLILKQANKTTLLSDPGGQKQVFYHFEYERFFACSSPKLFYDVTGFEFEISEEKQKILNSKRFRLLEEWFPGDEYLDAKLIRLLPNFLLEIETQNLKRIPFQVHRFSKEELKKYIHNQIYGAMEACILRFDVVLNAVTAGSDSRLIFNSTPRDEKVVYFLFKRESENDVDLKIAKELAHQKKINLNVIQPEKLTALFLSEYKRQFLRPRVLSKLRNIEWLSKNYKNKFTVVIAGYAGEMLRNSTNSINPYHKRFENSDDLIDYLKYPKTDYLKK